MREIQHLRALWLLAVPLVLLLLRLRARRSRPAVAVSFLASWRPPFGSLRARLAWVPFGCRLLVLAALAVAIARPRSSERLRDTVVHGVDIMVALDVSGSMRAEDFQPANRLHVARELVGSFLDTRTSDRLGLIAFAGQAVTRCPLTLDYALLRQFLEETSFDTVSEDGTALGLAIATGVNRLARSPSQSRVLVLVTDGISNRGSIDPLTAADLARARGVKIYAVGVGTRGRVPIPIAGPGGGVEYVVQELPLDEPGLRRIASLTGGYYFRATDPGSFAEALARIGELEKTRIERRERVVYQERRGPFLIGGLALLALEGLLGATWLRRLP